MASPFFGSVAQLAQKSLISLQYAVQIQSQVVPFEQIPMHRKEAEKGSNLVLKIGNSKMDSHNKWFI